MNPPKTMFQLSGVHCMLCGALLSSWVEEFQSQVQLPLNQRVALLQQKPPGSRLGLGFKGFLRLPCRVVTESEGFQKGLYRIFRLQNPTLDASESQIPALKPYYI